MNEARLAVLAALLAAASLGGCATTRYFERAKLRDAAMICDADASLVYVRNKIEAAREGSFGGFGGAAAGSCGCQ
jgi:outer membrane lipoprotein SlyB